MTERLPALDAVVAAAAVEGLPRRNPIARAARVAPPSLRPTRLDPLQVDVFAAIIATLPAPPLRLVAGGQADG